MKETSTRRRVAGFTLVETMLAIALLAIIAVMASHTLLDTTRSIHRLLFEKRASSLVEMIFQQYTAYTAENYQQLAYYNVSNQQPKDFFNRPDNFGYDGILITTLATYSTNRSSCTVNVSLSWQTGGSTKVSTFVKTYVQTAQIGNGAPVTVYVKSPCSQGVSPDTIIQYCPGIAGSTVTATSNNGGIQVSQGTDSTGKAFLKQVLTSDNANIQVTAPTVFDYNKNGEPPSYYAVDGNGNYVASLTKTMAVTVVGTNTLVVTDFRPTGSLTGQVLNDDALIPDPPVKNMAVVLGTGSVVALGGSFQVCSLSFNCVVYTDPNGNFLFNNVIPSTVSIVGAGRPGSAPQIQKSDTANFQWGYANPQPVNVWPTDWSLAILHNPMTQGPTLGENIHIQRLGWAVVQVLNKISNLPYPNIVLNAIVTPMAFQSTLWNSPAMTSDSSGQVIFYNLFATNNTESVTLGGGRTPTPTDYGAAASSKTFTLTDAMGQANNITFPVMPGYHLAGQFIDDNPTSELNGMLFRQGFPFPVPGAVLSTPLDANGHFSFYGFIPTSDAASSINQTLTLENFTSPVAYSIQGNTYDQVTGAHAPHTTLAIRDGGTNLLFSSDASGFINITSTMPYYTFPTVTVTCDDTSMECVICPNNTACPVSGGGLPVYIDTRINAVTFNPVQNGHGYVYKSFQATATQGMPSVVSVPCTLQDYAVKGTVTDLASAPLGGITIESESGVLVATTANGPGPTLGAYNGWVTVDGHDATDVGTISLSVPAQGGYFADSVGPIALPATIDPTIPLIQNIQLGGSSTGPGGGI